MTAVIQMKVCQYLAGQDRPVVLDDTLHISPAMAKLIENTPDDDLHHVITNLNPIVLPRHLCSLLSEEMNVPFVATHEDRSEAVARYRYRPR